MSPIPPSRCPISRVRCASPMSDRWKHVAGDRSARGGRPHRRADLPDAGADRAGADQRRAHRRSLRRHHRHGCRLGGEADRRLSGRGSQPAGDGRLSSCRIAWIFSAAAIARASSIPPRFRPGKPQRYRFALPTTNHVFLPGHRIMVQIQSSWFPLYDRNPQTFVPNIFFAKPADYVKATQTIFRTPEQPSAVWLPVVP